MNDYQFKVVKLKGDFVWHDHVDTDETFVVLEGRLRIDFRDGAVELAEGEMFVVPKGETQLDATGSPARSCLRVNPVSRAMIASTQCVGRNHLSQSMA